MSHNYVPQWRYCPPRNALPWKIMFLEPDLLVSENREQETGRTFFSCLSLESGREVQKEFDLGASLEGFTGQEGFMAGLETARGGLFYVHGYEQNSPEHRGIWAVNPLRNVIAWARPEASFVAHLQDGMLVYASGSFAGFPERSYYILDAERGEVLDAIGRDSRISNSMRRESLSDEDLQQVILPDVTAHDPMLPVVPGESFSESIEHDGLHITVVHTAGKNGEGFDATITVFRGGIKIYQDSLAKNTTVPCVNYFLLRNVTLYYIRDMNELISVRF